MITEKKLIAKTDVECMSCKACMIACAGAYFKGKPFDEANSCIQLNVKGGVTMPTVCVQCGACAAACPEGAIKQNSKGVYTVNKKLCKGCGDCVKACPFHLMLLAPQAAAASKCIACGICAKACPQDLLKVVELVEKE